jgi:leucyl-tRNA synthetase
VNWCPNCKTVLANEQVLGDGNCERCSTRIVVRDLEQWFFRITDFAEQLLEGLNRIDWPEATKTMQRHWIGRSEGTEIDFKVDGSDRVVHCFTTRPDTLFGVTYIVLAPENELVSVVTSSEHRADVETYITRARETAEIDRLATDREKTGIFTGGWAINPANGERVPIWIGDYVVASYGTGAVMAVPGHDQRDYEFAGKYGLPIKWVIRPENLQDDLFTNRAYEVYGVMFNSGQFDGLTSQDGIQTVTNWLKKNDSGRYTISYRIRDWLISRQRYWGAPIPIIHCPKCGLAPVPEEELPVLLPEEGVDFTPRGTSPLGACKAFIETTCPTCGGVARRDPDTMDTFVCSSWYFLRYVSTHQEDQPFDLDLIRRWFPVDVYIGGPEHATGHLIYARYITKYLNSLGLLMFDEPFQKLVHQGIITHKGQRMSKSKGNVVNPDTFVDQYGSDCFRLYLMFMGDFTVGGDWSDEGIVGVRRFQNRVWRLYNDWSLKLAGIAAADDSPQPNLDRVKHHSIREVGGDIEKFQFNTAISRLMEFLNALSDYTAKPNDVNQPFLKSCLETFALLLAPLAPHMSEELWSLLSYQASIHNQTFPKWDDAKLEMSVVTVVIQINGKFIERLTVPKGATQEAINAQAMELPRVKRLTSGREMQKVIYVPDRILNIVV